VDVHTGRIPHEVPESLSGSLELRDSDNANQRTAAGRIDGGVGKLAFHFDGFYRDADEYEIPGFAESPALRAREEGEGGHDDHGDEHEDDHDSHDDEHSGEAEAFGKLPNSQLKAQGGAFGATYVGDKGFFGLSIASYGAEYGLPGHSHAHHHDEDEHDDHDEDEHDDHEEEAHNEEGGSILDLSQTRFDLEAGIEDPLAGLEANQFPPGLQRL
jgi:iron complex outermembrane receptor protein